MNIYELEHELNLVLKLASEKQLDPIDATVLIIELQRSIINELHKELNERKSA